MSEELWHSALLRLEDLHTRFEMAVCAIPYASSVHLVVYVSWAGPKITGSLRFRLRGKFSFTVFPSTVAAAGCVAWPDHNTDRLALDGYAFHFTVYTRPFCNSCTDHRLFWTSHLFSTVLNLLSNVYWIVSLYAVFIENILALEYQV